MGAHDEQRGESGSKGWLYFEDAVILLAVVALFILTVFFRDKGWGQACLVGVLILMAVVFFLRFRRVHRAFTGGGEDA